MLLRILSWLYTSQNRLEQQSECYHKSYQYCTNKTNHCTQQHPRDGNRRELKTDKFRGVYQCNLTRLDNIIPTSAGVIPSCGSWSHRGTTYFWEIQLTFTHEWWEESWTFLLEYSYFFKKKVKLVFTIVLRISLLAAVMTLLSIRVFRALLIANL